MDPEHYRELFVQQAREILQGLNRCLVALEQAPGDELRLRETYRVMHTLKSMAATTGYQRTAELCHGLESVLDRAVEGSGSLTPKLMELLFTSVDQLERLTSAATPDEERWEETTQVLLEQIVHAAEAPPGALAAPRREGATTGVSAGTPATPARATTVRITVKRLDNLINLTGELLIIKSRLRTLGAALNAPALKDPLDQLDRVSDNLQREVLEARMLPIGSVFDRFARTVRDLARESGKQVDLVIGGQEIELDRTILDDISEPLIHLLRNAVSYGIEAPQRRARQGKPETGTITLAATREADRIVLEVRDDGPGLDLEEIRAVAVRKGFLSAEQAETLSPPDLTALLFLPGFSTATAVTEMSGRGVGLNVVKTRVEALRGSVEVTSVPAAGTRFVLRFPPTLAILEALLVGVRGDTFAIPMVDVAEVLEINRAEVLTQNLLVVRGKVVSVVDLGRTLGLDGPPAEGGRAFVLISSLMEGGPGFIVDHVAGQQQIVIKPVERPLDRIAGVSGATIVGDGRPVLILDLHALVREEARERSGAPVGL